MNEYGIIIGATLIAVSVFVLINIFFIDIARGLVEVWKSKKSAFFIILFLIGIDIIAICFIAYALKG